MTGNQPDDFTETAEMPRGRKPRIVADKLWEKLTESAKRGVAFSKSNTPEVIEELRKDLCSAAVRAKYDVRIATDKADAAIHKLTFAAKRRPEKPTDKKTT
jgi:hypothetical protein